MSKTLGIAFGGSGAEGIACVAYIKALEEAGIKPDIVSGTGMGGVAAAMYASGMSSADIIDFLKEIEFPGSRRPINIAKLKDARIGILDDMGLEEYFKMVVPIKVFDRLYFPLKIVAAGFESGAEVVFCDGDVARAVRAGASVPGIFSPYEKDGIICIDGSCVNPVPFDVIRADCEVLAAIEPCADLSLEGKGRDITVFEAMMNSYASMRKSLAIEKRKSCAVELYEYRVIEEISTFDFALYEDILSSAEENASIFAEKLQKML